MVGTPLYEEPILHGDKETVQRKRSRGTIASGSHRPDFVMESKQQKERGRPRKITFDRALNYEEQVFDVNAVTTDDENHGEISPNAKTTTSNSEFVVPQVEVEVQKYNWAIRRMPPHCVRKCFGMVQGKRCTNIMQSTVWWLLVFGENMLIRIKPSINGCGSVTMMSITQEWWQGKSKGLPQPPRAG